MSNDLNPGSSSAAEHATVRVAVSVNPSREVTARWSNVVIVLVTAVVAMAVVVGQCSSSAWRTADRALASSFLCDGRFCAVVIAQTEFSQQKFEI